MPATIDLGTVSALGIGGILPILVGLFTKVTTHPAAKGGTLLALAGGTGAISQWIESLHTNGPFHWQTAVTSAIGAFVVGVSSHSAIWKNTRLSNSGSPFGQSPYKDYDGALITPIGFSDDVDTSDLADDSIAPAESSNGKVAEEEEQEQEEEFVPAHLRFESQEA